MIQSLLDNDRYTWTVGDAVFQRFPNVSTRFEFKCRDNDVKFNEAFKIRFAIELARLDGMYFQQDELQWLFDQDFLSPSYLQFLAQWSWNNSEIHWKINEDQRLELCIVGPWADAMIYEVPLLATINECYFATMDGAIDINAGEQILDEKIKKIAAFPFSLVEFGTRRRLSMEWQDHVVGRLTELGKDTFKGTSNCWLARRHGIPSLGTQSHQFYMGYQAMTPLQSALRSALDDWLLIHEGRNAVALTDILGSEVFYKTLTPLHWKAYDGFRQDSGDPIWWLQLTQKKMRENGVNPRSKTVYLSNSLDVRQCLELRTWRHEFKDCVFCIGTKLTNHFPHKPLNIVIKMTKCNGAPVAKISDDAGKGMCQSSAFLQHLCNTYGLKYDPNH